MIWLLSFLFICLAVGGLAIGVIFGRKPLQGSCGGLNNFEQGNGCDLCGGSREKCAELSEQP
jgi:hypothetical protein